VKVKRSVGSVVLVFLVMAASLTVFWQVKGQLELEEKPFYELTVSVDKTFYLRGETVAVTVQSNASTAVTLSVYGPENKLIYSGTKTTDSQGVAVWSLPISQTASYGAYTFRANISDTLATTWATVLDASNWKQVTSFPYIREHKNIRYQIWPRRIVAESLTTGDILNVTYPYLDIFSKLDVSAFENSMCLRFRITQDAIGLKIDFTYAFIHTGCKIIINGSIPQEYDFKFKLAHPKTALQRVKKLLDGLKVGNVVFDWSDIRKAKQAFSWDSSTKELTVHIPQTFTIDPEIFSDGFESGDFSAWSGTSNTGSDSQINVVSTESHHGTYGCKANITVEGANWEKPAQVYETVNDPTDVYVRAYVKIAVGPDSGYQENLVGVGRSSSIWHCKGLVGVKNVSGTLYWLSRAHEEDGSRTYKTSSTSLQLNTWYSVEIRVKQDATAGEIHVWVDGTELTDIAQTGLNLDGTYTVNNIKVGLLTDSRAKVSGFPEVYIDCVVVSDSYIGPETEGDTTPPTYSDVGYNTTLAGQPCLFSCKWQDDTGLSGYIFSWNASGAWQNDTWTTLSSNPDWANVTKTLPSTVGVVVGFRWYCNDTSNNWNVTVVYTLTTSGYQVTVTVKPNNQRGVLYKANVTVYSGDSPIASQLTNISGQAVFSLPAQTLNFTVYDSVGQKLASVNITVSSNGQEETIIANQNYVDASLSWQFVIVAGSLVFSSSPKLRKKRGKEVKTRG